MSAQFTPAPWRISEDDLGYLSIRTGERNSAPDADLVASVYDEADASLIIAAPELYAALERCRARLLSVGQIGRDDDVLELSLAALTKARGEHP